MREIGSEWGRGSRSQDDMPSSKLGSRYRPAAVRSARGGNRCEVRKAPVAALRLLPRFHLLASQVAQALPAKAWPSTISAPKQTAAAWRPTFARIFCTKKVLRNPTGASAQPNIRLAVFTRATSSGHRSLSFPVLRLGGPHAASHVGTLTAANAELAHVDAPVLSQRLNDLGLTWRTLGDHHKAIGYFARAFDAVQGDTPHLEVARDINENIGVALDSLFKPRPSLDYSIQSFKGVRGDTPHPDVARDLNDLGLAWHTLGDHQKAIDCYEKAYAILEATLPQDHPSVQLVDTNLRQAQNKQSIVGGRI